MGLFKLAKGLTKLAAHTVVDTAKVALHVTDRALHEVNKAADTINDKLVEPADSIRKEIADGVIDTMKLDKEKL